MPTRSTTENLSLFGEARLGRSLSSRLLRMEEWLAARASARALYRMDDLALSDIALSRSDVERVNATTHSPLRR